MSNDSNPIRTALELYSTGKYGLRAIGQQLGVSHEQVRQWMLDELGPEYASLQRKALITRIVEADTALESATSMVDIARENARCRYVRWDAERRLPSMFSQHQQITHEVGPQLGDILERASQRVAKTRHAALPATDNGEQAIDGTAQRIDK